MTDIGPGTETGPRGGTRHRSGPRGFERDSAL